MTDYYCYQTFCDFLVSETEIPIPGTLDDPDLEELIDYDLYRDGTPFSNPDHAPSSIIHYRNFSNSNQFEPPWLWFVQAPRLVSVSSQPSGDLLEVPVHDTCTWPQFPKVIVDCVESVNASAFENHSSERSPGCGEVLDEIQISDLYSGVPQNVPELVNEEGPINAPVQIVHYRPETIDNASKSNRLGVQEPRREKKSVARKKGLDQTARETICLDDTGKVTGTLLTFGAKQGKRSSFDAETKKATATTRKEGACMRCRKGRKRCNWVGDHKYELCMTCMNVRPGSLKMPCFLEKITDAALFRLRPATDNPLHNWGFRRQVSGLEDDTGTLVLRALLITQDVGTESSIPISVTLFTPEPRDKTSYVWRDETGENTMEMPHYWITNIQEAKKIVGEYIKRSAHEYIELALKGSDNIVRDTFFVAARVASSGNKPMVQRALELWSASRMIEKTWRICSEDKLGLEVSIDLANPWNGIIPVTPMMDTQLDQIVIQDVLVPLRSGLLQELQKKIHGRRREDWFEIFLTVFILLSNTEFILAHSRRFARRYGMGGRYGYLGQYSSSEGFFHAAKVLLAYFHFVSRGHLPLSLDWTSSSVAATSGAEQAEYMNRLKEQLRKKEERGESVLGLRSEHKYETDLYWCHQMFFEGWTPGLPHIEETEVYEQASPVRCEFWGGGNSGGCVG